MTQPKIEYEKAKCESCGKDSPFNYEAVKDYFFVFCGESTCQCEMKKYPGHTIRSSTPDKWCVFSKKYSS